MSIVFLSNRQLSHAVFWRNLTPPLEAAFGREPDVRVVAPPAFRRATFRADRPAWLDALKAVRSADAVFWVQDHLRPPLPIWALAYAGPLTRRYMLVMDAWRQHLDDLALFVRTQRLTACYVTYTQALDVLRERYPELPFRWLPLGYNSDVFHDLGVTRDIDVFWMGRLHQPLHEAIRDYCDRQKLVYRYSRDAFDPPTSEELNELIARSRYFVAATPNLEDSARTGGFRPLTTRYLEGAAAGSRLIGVAPIERELAYFLPPGSLVECSPDGSDFAGVVEGADGDPGSEGSRVAARDMVCTSHPWSNRTRELANVMRREL